MCCQASRASRLTAGQGALSPWSAIADISSDLDRGSQTAKAGGVAVGAAPHHRRQSRQLTCGFKSRSRSPRNDRALWRDTERTLRKPGRADASDVGTASGPRLEHSAATRASCGRYRSPVTQELVQVQPPVSTSYEVAMAMVRISVRVTPELAAKVRLAAKLQGKSVSAFIREALARYLPADE